MGRCLWVQADSNRRRKSTSEDHRIPPKAAWLEGRCKAAGRIDRGKCTELMCWRRIVQNRMVPDMLMDNSSGRQNPRREG